MHAVLESINNRDISLFLWVTALLAWSLSKKNVRDSLRALLQSVAQRKIVLSLVASLVVVGSSCYALSLIGLWGLSQLKGAVIWFFAACIPSMVDTPKLAEDVRHFRHVALKNFKLSVLVDFYLNLFHAPLVVELVLVPVAALLTAMLVLAERKDEYKQVHSFLTNVLALIGLCWVVFQTYKLFTSFGEIRNMDTVRDFVLPIALNLMFLPMMVLLAIYAAYDSVFARVGFVVKDERLRPYTKAFLIVRCGLNYMKVNRWLRLAWQEKLETRAQIWRSIARA